MPTPNQIKSLNEIFSTLQSEQASLLDRIRKGDKDSESVRILHRALRSILVPLEPIVRNSEYLNDSDFQSLFDIIQGVAFQFSNIGLKLASISEVAAQLVEKNEHILRTADLLRRLIIETREQAVLQEVETQREAVHSVAEEAKEAQSEINEVLKDVQESAAIVRQDAADSAMRITLDTARKFYEDLSKRYLWVGIGLIILTIIVLVSLFCTLKSVKDECYDLECYVAEQQYLLESGENNSFRTMMNEDCVGCLRTLFYTQLIKSIMIRIVTISLLFWILGFLLRSINALSHNYVVTQHRVNSLVTAHLLIGRAKTRAENVIILNRASSAIFAHQPSGFNHRLPDNLAERIIQAGKEKKE